MTVNTTNITSGPYSGNDVSDTFSYTFRVENKNQLKVFETDSSGVVSELVVDTDYTVNSVGSDAGGTITRAAGALPTGYVWYIRSNYQPTQLTDFQSQGAFFPAVHEGAIDKGIFLIQQLYDLINRSLKFSESYAGGASAEIPDPEALMFLRWNSDGTALENVLGTGETSFNIFTATQVITDGQLVYTFANAIAAKTGFYLSEPAGQSGKRMIVGYDYKLRPDIDANTIELLSSFPAGWVIQAVYTNDLAFAGVGSDDINFTLVGAGSVTRTVTDRLSDWVNALDFGVSGSGTVDDSVKLQAAIDYVDSLTRGSSQGGTLFIPDGDYLIRSSLRIPRNVNITGESSTETRLSQDDLSFGPVMILLPEGNTTNAKECPQSQIKNLKIDGNNSGFITVNGTVTNGSQTVTVDDTSDLFAGMLVEANGVTEGTTILSVTTATTLQLSANANATVTDKNIGFRTAYSVTLTTTSGSTAASVDDATNLKVGMQISNANTQASTFIDAISGTNVTLSRTASATGSASATASVYNTGIFAKDHSDASDFDAGKNIRGPLLENIDITQMSGDGIHMRPGNSQIRALYLFNTNCRGHGGQINSCNDSSIFSCGFGSNWKSGLTVTTSATFRVMSTECWQTFRNDIYYEFRSQANKQITFAFGEINGSAYVKNSSGSFEHNILFKGVNFKFTAKNLRYTDGVMEGYLHNDGTKTVFMEDCYFHEEEGTLEKPNYIVNAIGDSQTLLLGTRIASASYVTDISNNFADVCYAGADTDIESAFRMSRLRLDRYSTQGKIASIYFDNSEVGALEANSTRPRFTSSNGIAIDIPGPFADDSAASAAGISVGQAYRKASGDIVARVS